MARLVVGDQPFFVGPEHDRAAEAEHGPFDGLVEVGLRDQVLTFLGRQQGRLVGDVAQVCADETSGRPGDLAQVDVGCEAKVAGVDLEDRFAAGPVGRRDGDAPIEPPWT